MKTLSIDLTIEGAERIAKIMRADDPAGDHALICTENYSYTVFGGNASSFEVSDEGIGHDSATESARRLQPDLVLIGADILSRGSEAYALAAGIQAASPQSSIIYVSGVQPALFREKQEEKSSGSEKSDDHERQKDTQTGTEKRLHIQCFGNFEVFSEGKPIHFFRALSKEALAYLVDRRGAACTVAEISTILWEDRLTDRNRKAQCRVILSCLRRDLGAVGAEDILIKTGNAWSVDTEKFTCDYYDYLKGDTEKTRSFRGEYMSQYSWAEMTMGSLVQDADMDYGKTKSTRKGRQSN